ncbi:MAG: hypothetical protein ABI609_07915 [Acidobacteriota bacterium]
MFNVETPSHGSSRPASRTAFSLALACGLVFATVGWSTPPPARSKPQQPTASWQVLDAVATVGLDASTLSGLGLDLADVKPSVSGHGAHPLSVVPWGAPSFAVDNRIDLRAAVAVDGFHAFEGGSLHSRGGFMLRPNRNILAAGSARTIDFSRFELRPGVKAGVLEIVDTAGVALLATADAQWEFDAKRGALRYLNADVRILPELARRLGDPRYAGMTVGVMDMDVTLKVGAIPASLPVTNVPPACNDWSGTLDVALTNMSSIGQAGIATVDGRSVVVVLPSADLKNVGTANVPWFSKFTNLGVAPWNDQHPFLVWQMLRATTEGILEPLGKSDLKHAFLTLNNGCDVGACTNSNVLGQGCTDVYGTSTNNSTNSLAPRSEVTASTGIWNHCGGVPSHFDTNGDCTQDFSGSGENAFTHGLKAAESELQLAGAKYYVEAFYIIRDDHNIFNSMGYRQVAPAKPASTWSFPMVGAYAQGPAINAWVHAAPFDPGTDNEALDTGEGHVQLAVRTTDVVGSPGRRRFAYALQNHDFDRQIKSFRVPFDTTLGVFTNVKYADGDAFAANDWTSAIDPTGITWTAPAATTPPAEIDYATLVSFSFEVDANAAPAQATLGTFESGPTTELQIGTLAPAVSNPTFTGSYFTIQPCRLVDTRSPNGPSGGPALTTDQARVLEASRHCNLPSTAKSVALNVTAVNPDSAGHVVVFSGTLPNTSSLEYPLGRTRANNMVVGLAVDGTVKIQAVQQQSGTLQVVVDALGYFE